MPTSTFASRALRFYTGLTTPRVPRGVVVMNPYRDGCVRGYVRAFLNKYFSDNLPRTLVFGINPGRFGAGLTGVTFTDPVALFERCGIANDLPQVSELSSHFIYKFIEECGGPQKVYHGHFLTAVSPLGLTREGINLNYYDDPVLARRLTPFIVSSIERQIALGGRTDRAIVLGVGENLKFLRKLNEAHGFFGTISALEHPSWIMVYRRNQRAKYLAKYQEAFGCSDTP